MDEERTIAAGYIPPIEGSRSEVMGIIRKFHRMDTQGREAIATALAGKSDSETAKLVGPIMGSIGGIPKIGIQSAHLLLLSIFFKAVELGQIEFTEP